MAELAEEHRDYWTKLDSDIGDGDHGINLSIGFRAVNANLQDNLEKAADVTALLKKSGMLLLSKVGGDFRSIVWQLLYQNGQGRCWQRSGFLPRICGYAEKRCGSCSAIAAKQKSVTKP